MNLLIEMYRGVFLKTATAQIEYWIDNGPFQVLAMVANMREKKIRVVLVNGSIDKMAKIKPLTQLSFDNCQ